MLIYCNTYKILAVLNNACILNIREIRKIRRIFKKIPACQLPLQTGSSKASKKTLVRADFTDFTEIVHKLILLF